MLDRAREKVDHYGWANVYLLQQDARQLNLSDVDSFTGNSIRVGRILCTLG